MFSIFCFIKFLRFIGAIFGLVHDMEVMHGLCNCKKHL